MNRTLSLLAVVALLLSAPSASAMSAAQFDAKEVGGQKLDITNRYRSGLLDKRLVTIHTNQLTREFYKSPWKANHESLRRHGLQADCVLLGINCKPIDERLQTADNFVK